MAGLHPDDLVRRQVAAAEQQYIGSLMGRSSSVKAEAITKLAFRILVDDALPAEIGAQAKDLYHRAERLEEAIKAHARRSRSDAPYRAATRNPKPETK